MNANILAILAILAPARAIAMSANCRTVVPPTPCHTSQRTYYLGTNGRVSQRKHLVGETVTTVRACSTEHARYLFHNALAHIQVQAERIMPSPYIGKTKQEAIPQCWYRAKNALMSEPALNDPNPRVVHDLGGFTRSL